MTATQDRPTTVRAERWQALIGHRDQLLRIARSRTSSLEDAEDCVQEALTRAVEFADLDLDRAGAFLTTTTIRLTTDLHRARTRQARLVDRVGGQGQAGADSSDYAEDIADHSLARWLHDQTGTLTEQERAILSARVAGASSREAAEALGISVRAAESSFTRVRSKLQGAWARVAVLVGALVLGARRHAAVTVPVAAVAVTVALGPVTLLPSTSPVAPGKAQSSPVLTTSAPATSPLTRPAPVVKPRPVTKSGPARAISPSTTAAPPAAGPKGRHRWEPTCGDEQCPPPLVPVLLKGALLAVPTATSFTVDATDRLLTRTRTLLHGH